VEVVKAAATAFRVNVSRSSGEKLSVEAIAYSCPMVVQTCIGRSVASVTGMPRCTKRLMG